jgi:hypothetical protein
MFVLRRRGYGPVDLKRFVKKSALKTCRNFVTMCSKPAVREVPPICEDGFMPKLTRGAGAFGLALSAYDVWRKLPPERRKMIVAQVRKHGPTVMREATIVARAAAKRARTR